MLKGYDLMRAFGKYSIIFSLSAPIYVFASGEYTDGAKLALSILIILVNITTYFYWSFKDMKKSVFWKIADRLTVVSLLVIPAIFGDNDVRTFLALSVYFYLLGYSSDWVDHNGHLNHAAFRFFGAFGVILYIVKPSDDVVKIVFLSLLLTILVSGAYLIIKDSKEISKVNTLKKSTIIF